MFYSSVEINGQARIPKESSNIIFAPNHQSAFLDAILVAVFSTQPIHFLTRADVFTFPFKYILRSLNMMPVYRIRDGYKSLSKNDAVFETCKDLLQDGKPILLFPEASQSLVYYLRPLSRGLSRIAHMAQEGFDKPIYIVPVGLNYFDQFRAGSRLILNFGEPINVKQILDQEEIKAKAINDIRVKTFEDLKTLILIPERDADYKKRLEYLNPDYYKFTFSEIITKLENPKEISRPRPAILDYIISAVLMLPNFIYHTIDYCVIRFLVKDPTFHASIRVSFLMFLMPLYLILSFIFFCSITGMTWAVALCLFQIISYLIWKQHKSRLL